MAKRRPISKAVVNDILVQSRRRCCLCFFLNGRQDLRRGQIAHISQDPSDGTIDNLVYLCLEHHDEYDSQTRQSKGLTEGEVRHFRDRLYAHYRQPDEVVIPPVEEENCETDVTAELPALSEIQSYARVRNKNRELNELLTRPWRFACLGVTANQPEYFAFKSWNRCDGVCLIERIDLPDERIVIVCIETSANPGQSITNAVEELAFQVCERLKVPPARLVWLENYDIEGHYVEEWNWVRFDKMPPESAFEGPRWVKMTAADWASLRLRPRTGLRAGPSGWQAESKLQKLFEWPLKELGD